MMPADRLTPGLTHRTTHVVTRAMSPPHLEGILATSPMIGLIEDTCLSAIRPWLDDAETTVGTRVDVTHVGVARTGDAITITVRLTKVTQGRLLSFEVKVEAPSGVISSGTHQRLVVETATFLRS